MIVPIEVATDGYLHLTFATRRTLNTAVNGYLTLQEIIDLSTGGRHRGARVDVNPMVLQEDDEIVVILKMFLNNTN
jgi:hypothetical protein